MAILGNRYIFQAAVAAGSVLMHADALKMNPLTPQMKKDGWQAHFDKKFGKWYYYNKDTKKRQWEKPECAVVEQNQSKLQRAAEEKVSSSSYTSPKTNQPIKLGVKVEVTKDIVHSDEETNIHWSLKKLKKGLIGVIDEVDYTPDGELDCFYVRFVGKTCSYEVTEEKYQYLHISTSLFDWSPRIHKHNGKRYYNNKEATKQSVWVIPEEYSEPQYQVGEKVEVSQWFDVKNPGLMFGDG